MILIKKHYSTRYQRERESSFVPELFMFSNRSTMQDTSDSRTYQPNFTLILMKKLIAVVAHAHRTIAETCLPPPYKPYLLYESPNKLPGSIRYYPIYDFHVCCHTAAAGGSFIKCKQNAAVWQCFIHGAHGMP